MFKVNNGVSIVSIVNFKHVNTCWGFLLLRLVIYKSRGSAQFTHIYS